MTPDMTIRTSRTEERKNAPARVEPCRRGRLTRALLALVLLLVGAPLLAFTEPENERGFDADKIYDVGMVDQVSLFNGNVTVTIPVGPLSLVYNSNLWNFEYLTADGAADPGFRERRRGEPAPGFNAGAGWTLLPGQLRRPNTESHSKDSRWTFISADGATHAFHRRLHLGDALDPANDPPGPGEIDDDALVVGYTRDGSYLRMQLFSNARGAARRVEFPDGSFMEFQDPVGATADPTEPVWLPIRQVDAFGNERTYTYCSASGATHCAATSGHAPAAWDLLTIEDRHQRKTSIRFSLPANGHYERLIHTVTAPAFASESQNANAVAPSENAVWTFEYHPLAGVPVPGPCSFVQPPGYYTLDFQLHLLKAVVGPDGSTWSFNKYGTDAQIGSLCSNASGKLLEMQVPTGGKIAWTFQGWNFPARETDFDSQGAFPTGWNTPGSIGVAQRIYYERDEPTVHELANPSDPALVGRVWDYSQSLFGRQAGERADNASKVVVTDPVGDVVEHYFSVDRDGMAFDPDDWRVLDYGLPFSRHESESFDVGDETIEVYLSRKILNAAGQPLRSIYVRYESDGVLNAQDIAVQVEMGSASDFNRRQVAELTVYHDDGDRTSGWVNAEFDGFGHYRSKRYLGTFGNDRDDEEYTAYSVNAVTASGTPDTGTLVVTSTGDELGFDMPSRNEMPTWLLGNSTFRERVLGHETTDAVEIRRVETVEHPRTGVLLCQRTLSSLDASRSANDLVTKYTYNSHGELTRERLYGGDGAGLDTAALELNGAGSECDLGGYGAAAYRQDYAYAFDNLASADWVDDRDGSTVLNVADRTIDGNTGLVWKARDPAGHETTLDYDALGRMVSALPFQQNETTWSYTPADYLGGAQVKATAGRFTSGLRSGRTNHVFDDWGRVCIEQALRPPGVGGAETWNAAARLYDAAGRLTHQSVVYDTGSALEADACPGTITAGVTISSDFDALGRPATITRPDGTSMTYTFQGERITSTRSLKATRVGGGTQWITDRSERNHRGQEISMVMAEGRSEAGETTYRYLAGGELGQVRTGAESANADQTRELDYDGRGFLVGEFLPEVGSWIRYAYDALGHRTAKSVAGLETLSYGYDRAGRPLRVDEVLAGGGSRRLKEFTYYRTNKNQELRRGKLATTKRHNYGRPPGATLEADVIVTEIHRYHGSVQAGRKASVETRLSSDAFDPRIFRQEFTWNAWGQLTSSEQPRCLSQNCLGSDEAHTIRRTWARDRVVNVTGERPTATRQYAQNIFYHPGGLPSRIAPDNGTAQVILLDDSGMNRPGNIRVKEGQNVLWETGVFGYDGVGNIQSLGSGGAEDAYLYDGRSRLIQATLRTVTGAPRRDYSYDTYGNLTQIEHNDLVHASLAADPTSNRLLAGLYDSDGNLVSSSLTGATYTYDGLDMLSTVTVGSLTRAYAYTASGERMLEIDFTGTSTVARFTVRGPEKKPARRWRSDASGYALEKDYVYREGSLLASIDESGALEQHYLDHLGTIRLTADQNGVELSRHAYYPYGEATTTLAHGERLRFTGHERDDLGAGSADDLDYMHARYYSPHLGRFTTVDPGRDGWNLYAYVGGNPVSSIDPDGRAAWFLPLVYKAAQGAAVGGAINAGLAYATGERDAQKIGAAFLSGSAEGAVGAFVGGGPKFKLLAEATLSTASSALERALDGDPDTETFDGDELKGDFVSSLLNGAMSKTLGKMGAEDLENSSAYQESLEKAEDELRRTRNRSASRRQNAEDAYQKAVDAPEKFAERIERLYGWASAFFPGEEQAEAEEERETDEPLRTADGEARP